MANTSGGEPQTLGSTFYLYHVDPFGVLVSIQPGARAGHSGKYTQPPH